MSIGPFNLDKLEVGQWRIVAEEELARHGLCYSTNDNKSKERRRKKYQKAKAFARKELLGSPYEVDEDAELPGDVM